MPEIRYDADDLTGEVFAMLLFTTVCARTSAVLFNRPVDIVLTAVLVTALFVAWLWYAIKPRVDDTVEVADA